MPVSIDSITMNTEDLTRDWANGKGPTGIKLSVKWAAIKFMWEGHGEIRYQGLNEEFNNHYLWYKRRFPSLSKSDLLRFLCQYMLVADAIKDIEHGGLPLMLWLSMFYKEKGFRPDNEVVEEMTRKTIEKAEKDRIEKVKLAMKKLGLFCEISLKNKVETKTRLKWLRALDTASNICADWGNDAQTEGALNNFNEQWQDYYETKIEEEGLGDVEDDAKMLKDVYGWVKEIYEATPIAEKKKTRRGGKKKKAPPIPPAPPLETIIGTGNEVIVWDGGDVWENIVLTRGIFVN